MILLLALACTLDDRLLVDVPVVALPSTSEWTLPDSTRVTLTEATTEVADLRLEQPADPVARLAPFVPSLLGAAAWAHPGHDFAGDVVGELLGTWPIDWLGDDAQLGVARVYEGDVATSRLRLTEAAAVLAGSVTLPDGAVIPFRFTLVPDREVTEIVTPGAIDAAEPPRRLTLTFDPAHALSYVDWSTLPGDDDTLTEADGALAATGMFGLTSTPTWALTLDP